MKGYVITISSIEQSLQAAERCIRSAGKVGFEVEKFEATTPEDNPGVFLSKEGIGTRGFVEEYSRFDNCIAAFTSHYRLWKKSVEDKETLLVLEHDAYFVDQIPNVQFDGVLSFGRPSYGRWIAPSTLGKNKLISKQYLPGAHAYAVTPKAAEKLIEKAKVAASPTDIFINNNNFDFIEEYYPWPVEARDSFSTIQKELGCQAKHNYSEAYELI